ncbi:DUF1471 domain-containing protein [Providencia rettgeri]|uniref:DUF1471 domain-containing protein n=2 Tax=Providencia TaxID=586 RepID=A0A8E3YLR2_PRORE|nr:MULTISPECIES: DUF1471 domain-containing protein [Providencia]NIL71120.1 DUF1471 domain-containing protein [Providencia sp. 504mA]WOC03879.1 DUF1471 domain-containing protein [Providencia sp. PROV024]HCI95427.1 DUF1471 domain-containing protein [Providencia sp.]EIL1983243.1 DUF1471 domain-containing protein [Providencia rettgeri]EIU7558977.1 DUF1471 domain-containing protein [Providencia rettgeri]
MMKKMIVLLALSLFSYQGLASGNKVNFQPVSNKIIENNSSTEPHRKILVTKTFVGDASLSSIEMQAQQEAKKLGASRYKIVGASGENQLRGHVTFYQ